MATTSLNISLPEALKEFDVPFEADVVSAHRMPDEMLAYGREAADRGLSVIIAGAGGAAHLPGMLAAVTPLSVIGVPVPLKHLDGMDSLLSIVQMPSGVPVATVAVGNARNAGLLAGPHGITGCLHVSATGVADLEFARAAAIDPDAAPVVAPGLALDAARLADLPREPHAEPGFDFAVLVALVL